MAVIRRTPGDDEEFERIADIFSPFKKPGEPALIWDGVPSDIKAAKSTERFYLRIEYQNSEEEVVGKDRYARETIESAIVRAIEWKPRGAVSLFVTTNEGEKLAFCYQTETGEWEVLASSDQAIANYNREIGTPIVFKKVDSPRWHFLNRIKLNLFQKKSPFEKRYRELLKDEDYAGSLQYVATNLVFRFPVRKFFKEAEQIDSVYFELSTYVLFSLDLYFCKCSLPDRELNFEANSIVLSELWGNSENFPELANDRLNFYGACVTCESGWPIAETAQNIFLSATRTPDRSFLLRPQLPPIAPEAIPLGAEWARWATLVEAMIPEIFEIYVGYLGTRT